MKYVSLFAGIGGGDLGFDKAGMRCVAQVENKRQCCRVLAHHWPNTLRFGDIEGILPGMLPRSDLVICSDPCQANTVANSRWNSGKKAKSLWHIARDLIDEVRPEYVIRENPTHLRKDAPSRHELVAAELGELNYVSTIIDMQCGQISGVSRQRTFVCAGIGASGEGLRAMLFERRCNKRDWPAIGSEKIAMAALTCHPYRYDNRDNFIHYPDGRIRVLSGTERLQAQGFPETWIDCLGKMRLFTAAKLTGNAWPVFAAKWIGDRLMECSDA